MNSNYNDIIDIILTLLDDDELSKYILVSGSIVPYLILSKESKDKHEDLYIYVIEEKMNFVRKRLNELSKEYLFDIISDSKWYSKHDCGFKINYEDTVAGFFPYSLEENNLIIKTYALNKSKSIISLKTKEVAGVSKNSMFKYVNLLKNKVIKVMSPEFLLASAKANGKINEDYLPKTIELLNNLSDESVLKVIEQSIAKEKVIIVKQKVKKNDIVINVILFILFVTLLTLAYICFK